MCSKLRKKTPKLRGISKGPTFILDQNISISLLACCHHRLMIFISQNIFTHSSMKTFDDMRHWTNSFMRKKERAGRNGRKKLKERAFWRLYITHACVCVRYVAFRKIKEHFLIIYMNAITLPVIFLHAFPFQLFSALPKRWWRQIWGRRSGKKKLI